MPRFWHDWPLAQFASEEQRVTQTLSPLSVERHSSPASHWDVEVQEPLLATALGTRKHSESPGQAPSALQLVRHFPLAALSPTAAQYAPPPPHSSCVVHVRQVGQSLTQWSVLSQIKPLAQSLSELQLGATHSPLDVLHALPSGHMPSLVQGATSHCPLLQTCPLLQSLLLLQEQVSG